ncbi:riboflavin biosynthesis protein RibF [Coraliomargarita sp. SDUM461004]|uniref:Riboflavin biosynthesis protein n=1 Tax=Thalassobacterium sedimentorum TaxID=3041258 RepID=A0ABU1AIA9_9BACT|nr:riboflavin biosynthesis protein RibF [Coraliomargarita sp. SDUM461004]MDQ8194359.1 riboflavin biosynthesis protein RibF [Coraliomargarita sp. SDUM461004]
MNFPVAVDSFEALAHLNGELHLAIGVFDGVHLGHKAVIESAVFSARRSHGFCGVLTFDPHPSRLFRPEAPTRLIMPIEMKTRMLHQVGVDCVIRKHFDHAFASIPADRFLSQLQDALPALKSIYVGENFRFGQKRAGDVSTLIESGRLLGLGVFSAERIKHNGQPISSTRIRQELEAGAIVAVNDLLGYNYTASGEIIRGAQLGRTIGFPTLNLPWQPECLPRFGVYYVKFRLTGSSEWASGVANYGVKPTVANPGQMPALEVHGLEPTDLAAGDCIEVEWLQFIRPEQKFDSIDALKAQIALDCATARDWAAR